MQSNDNDKLKSDEQLPSIHKRQNCPEKIFVVLVFIIIITPLIFYFVFVGNNGLFNKPLVKHASIGTKNHTQMDNMTWIIGIMATPSNTPLRAYLVSISISPYEYQKNMIFTPRIIKPGEIYPENGANKSIKLFFRDVNNDSMLNEGDYFTIIITNISKAHLIYTLEILSNDKDYSILYSGNIITT